MGRVGAQFAGDPPLRASLLAGKPVDGIAGGFSLVNYN